MHWSEIRTLYPEQWIVVEALEAHSTSDRYRIPDQLSVLEKCTDGSSAMNIYRKLHLEHPDREFYFVHTRNTEIRIQERDWVGVKTK